MPPDGASTAALLLLISSVSALTAIDPSSLSVLPPTNVKVSCQNLRTWVSWDSSHQQPGTSFKVETISSDGHHVNETTEHQYDLTWFIWESQNHFMGFHSVNVTALQQGRESRPVSSGSFTFNINRPAHKRCLLDFPPVDVTASESGNTVIFQNPVHFYAELRKADHLRNAFFEYNVSFDQAKNISKILQAYDLPHSEEPCVRLKGRLSSENRAEKVEFRETGRVCLSRPSEALWTTLYVLLAVLLLVICALSIGIYKARAWRTQRTPKALDIVPQDDECDLLTPDIKEVISPVMVLTCSKSLSVSSEDGGLQDSGLQDSGACSDSHSLYVEGRLSEGEDSEDAEVMDEEPADDEQVAERNYDRQHVPAALRVDFGDGDMAEVYRER